MQPHSLPPADGDFHYSPAMCRDIARWEVVEKAFDIWAQDPGLVYRCMAYEQLAESVAEHYGWLQPNDHGYPEYAPTWLYELCRGVLSGLEYGHVA